MWCHQTIPGPLVLPLSRSTLSLEVSPLLNDLLDSPPPTRLIFIAAVGLARMLLQCWLLPLQIPFPSEGAAARLTILTISQHCSAKLPSQTSSRGLKQGRLMQI